ncbi:MAG: DUF1028 domain-containing protein [Thermoprotei archaeon]|jgi:uncharacterized Ntn-hydrolase superfamily protein
MKVINVSDHINNNLRIVATFSIVASDPEVGDLGVAVASKFIAVGHVVPWVKIKVGAVATQALANVKYGPTALRYLSRGFSPSDVIKKLIEKDPKREHRQIGIVNAKGEAAAYTGSQCLPWAGHITGNGYSVQGNILAGENVVQSMASAFENTSGELVDKLLASLEAGEKAGGDRRGKQSAAIIVMRRCGGYGGCKEGVGKYVDIRVDDHPEPVLELRRIFKLWDLTLLSREDPSAVYEWDYVWDKIANALLKLGYLKTMPKSSKSIKLKKAFERWIGENNFENKLRKDGKIWISIYNQLIGTTQNIH